ncbi:hypothetical protein BGZ94_007534 [Podila epigama]|nr:hypothetical protein BGZ94_007534 [Podila epigama]
MKLSLLSLAAVAIACANAAPVEKRAASDKFVVGYWVPWGDVPVAQLDMSKYTHINYGFGVVTKKTGAPTDIFIDRYYDGNNIKALVKRGNTHGVPILISIGGWTGSQTFSTIVASPALRATFINNALVFVRNNTLPEYADKPDGWNMHGIDIDWEYPNRPELRAQLDLEFPNDRKLLTAAVRVQPFDGPNGQPLANVAAFANYFDYIALMAYDIMGGWSANTGPNAPFNNGPSGLADPYSFTQSIDAWHNAGFPLDKIVVGTAFYGRSVTATSDMSPAGTSMYGPKTNVTPKGGPADRNDINFFCNEGAVYSGMWKWKELRGAALSSPTTAAAGWTRHWDAQTQTPWLFRASDKTFVSYDDTESLAIKTAYAKQKGVKGLMLWDMSYDYNNELINVLQGIHCTSNCPVVTTVAPTTTTVAPTTATVPATTTVSPVTTSVGPSPTGPAGKCDGVAAWNAATVYNTAGTKVTHGGHLFTNQWWTTNETPSTSNQWGVWKDGGAC